MATLAVYSNYRCLYRHMGKRDECPQVLKSINKVEMGGETDVKKTWIFAVMAVLFTSTSFAPWQDVKAESVDDLDKKIAELNEEQNELKNKETEKKNKTEEKINKNLNEQDKVESEINKIDKELEKTQTAISEKEEDINATNAKIHELEGHIHKLQQEIEQLKAEINDLQERIQERDALLKDRLRSIQKSGGSIKYLEVLFGSQSFGDFISRITSVNTIMDQDKSIMEKQKA